MAVVGFFVIRSFLPGDPEAKPEREARDSLVTKIDSADTVTDSLLKVIDSMKTFNKDRKSRLKERIKIVVDPSINEVKHQRDSALAGWETADSIIDVQDRVIAIAKMNTVLWHQYRDRAESRIKKLENRGPKLLGIPLPEPVVSYSTPLTEFKPRLSAGIGYKIHIPY